MEKEWKPNLFVPGFPKCGTTALYNYLAQHPDIYTLEEKEPQTLVLVNNVEIPKLWSLDFMRDKEQIGVVHSMDEYKYKFMQGSTKIYRLDASQQYSYKSYYAHILKRFSPNAKIILMIRDHKERLVSLYLFTLLKYRHNYTFEEWLSMILQYINDLLFYDKILAFSNLFRNNLLVIDNKVLRNKPQYVIDNICKFLELENIEVKSIVSNVSVDNSGMMNKILFNYKLATRYMARNIRKMLKTSGLWNSRIHYFLKTIYDRNEQIIDINMFRSRHDYNKYIESVPTDVIELLDNDYKASIEFCKSNIKYML